MPVKTRNNRRRVYKSKKNIALINGLPNTGNVLNRHIANLAEGSPVNDIQDLKKYALSEIKWISIVTGIIIVLLIISYKFFY